MTNVACSAFSASPKLPPLLHSDCTRFSTAARKPPGIVAFDGQQFSVERHVGLIGDTFTKRSVMDRLPGDRAIGHTRYSTTGGEGLRNVQPFFAEFAGGGFAIAHNGNITNALTVQRELQQRGSIFSSTSDTETILHLIAVSEKTRIVPKFIDAITRIEGAYSLVGLSEKKMIGARDPLGIRPLCIGDLDGAYILASETCALDIIGARFVREVSPAKWWSSPTRASRAISRSRSNRRACASSNMSISPARLDHREPQCLRGPQEDRRGTGQGMPGRCRRDHSRCRIRARPRRSALPNRPTCLLSSALSAITMSDAPSSRRRRQIRHMGVKLKLNPNKNMIEGKRVVLVDDSIVRGTTSQKIVSLCARPAPAKCICASPRHRPCRRAFTVWTRRKNPSFWHRGCRSRRWRISSASTASVCVDRRPLPRRARARPQRRMPAILRRLLYRRLPDDAHRSGRSGQCPQPVAAGQQRIILHGFS
jgi:hypothetical protein